MEQNTDQNAVSLTTRNADLSSMVELLRTQQAAKTDHVVAASVLAALGGQMLVHGAGVELSMDGVTTGDLTLTRPVPPTTAAPTSSASRPPTCGGPASRTSTSTTTTSTAGSPTSPIAGS